MKWKEQNVFQLEWDELNNVKWIFHTVILLVLWNWRSQCIETLIKCREDEDEDLGLAISVKYWCVVLYVRHKDIITWQCGEDVFSMMHVIDGIWQITFLIMSFVNILRFGNVGYGDNFNYIGYLRSAFDPSFPFRHLPTVQESRPSN